MSEEIFLRALEESDLDCCLKWHNDISLYETLLGPFRYVSREAEQLWIKKKAGFSLNEINLAICIKGSNIHIGNIYLSEIDWISRRGHLSIFIGEGEHRGKGYGKSAVRQLLSYAFVDLGLKRIFLYVLEDNESAIHLYDKCGFNVEGRLKKHVFHKGVWKDYIVMGICSNDYHKINGLV